MKKMGIKIALGKTVERPNPPMWHLFGELNNNFPCGSQESKCAFKVLCHLKSQDWYPLLLKNRAGTVDLTSTLQKFNSENLPGWTKVKKLILYFKDNAK